MILGIKKRLVSTIQWGDLSTAHHSTGIPNIETFMAGLPMSTGTLKTLRYFGWLLNSGFMQNYMRKRIKSGPSGPSDEIREKGYTRVWGEVSNAKGETKRVLFKGPEAYTLTAHTSLMTLNKIDQGMVKPGFQTPSKAFGKDFILEYAGTEIAEV